MGQFGFLSGVQFCVYFPYDLVVFGTIGKIKRPLGCKNVLVAYGHLKFCLFIKFKKILLAFELNKKSESGFVVINKGPPF